MSFTDLNPMQIIKYQNVSTFIQSIQIQLWKLLSQFRTLISNHSCACVPVNIMFE